MLSGSLHSAWFRAKIVSIRQSKCTIQCCQQFWHSYSFNGKFCEITWNAWRLQFLWLVCNVLERMDDLDWCSFCIWKPRDACITCNIFFHHCHHYYCYDCQRLGLGVLISKLQIFSKMWEIVLFLLHLCEFLLIAARNTYLFLDSSDNFGE